MAEYVQQTHTSNILADRLQGIHYSKTININLYNSNHMAASLLEAGRSATAITDEQILCKLPLIYTRPVETKCQQIHPS
eukprot:10896572-Karenia_brevis.AAC.1